MYLGSAARNLILRVDLNLVSCPGSLSLSLLSSLLSSSVCSARCQMRSVLLTGSLAESARELLSSIHLCFSDTFLLLASLRLMHFRSAGLHFLQLALFIPSHSFLVNSAFSRNVLTLSSDNGSCWHIPPSWCRVYRYIVWIPFSWYDQNILLPFPQ